MGKAIAHDRPTARKINRASEDLAAAAAPALH
jgi:hypothetical protein